MCIIGRCSGTGSVTDGDEMRGVVPPEYHTGWVYTELVFPLTIDRVEFVAPATNP